MIEMTTERKPRSVKEQIELRLGVTIREAENPLVSSVGITDTIVAQNNPSRVALTIVNLSANGIYLRPKEPASASMGIFLAPNGGSMGVDMNDDYMLPTYEWHAIATGAASAIFSSESIIL